MPTKPSFAAVNLGMQTATLAVMAADKGSLRMTRLAQAGLLPDPSADSSRAGQLQIALGELCAGLGWKSGLAGCAVPSQGVFTRFVKIPKVSADQVGQVLHFEAQQNVPYAIEDVAWCYQVLPEQEADQLAAVLLAMKVDQLEATVDALQASHLSPSVIDTSPTSLYNAFRYNYPELVGCSLLIDIGARATNLLFIDGEHFFIRTLPIGGNSITTALQKKLDGHSIVEVERLKCEEGMLLPAGVSAGAGRPEVDEMGKTARTVMTRIHNEITRSITYYRTNQGGAAPVRAFLAGGGVSLPYTLEFFNEKLSLPVEFFNPLRNVAVGPEVDTALLKKSAHTLGECIGVGLRLSGIPCPLELDLKAPSLTKAATEAKRRPFLVAAAALLVGAVALAGLHFQKSAAFITDLSANTLQPEINSLQEIKAKIDQVTAEKNKLMSERSDLLAAPALRTAWLDIINDLAKRLPTRFIWVTKLRPVTGETVVDLQGIDKPAENAPAAAAGKSTKEITAILVEGLYRENDQGPEVVDNFVNALKESPVFNVSEENKASVLQVRATQNDDAWAYHYKMLLPLKRPIPL